MTKSDLNRPYSLTSDQIIFFRKNGFIKLKQVFSAEEITWIEKLIDEQVRRLNTQNLPLDQRDTYGKAFLQIMNIWTQSPEAKEFMFNKRLAGIARDLMEVEGVRIYHDQALYKEPGGGHTPWHADQYYWPLNSDRTITAWIPLQATPLNWGPLEFSAGSNQLTTGRDKAIGNESQQILEEALRKNNFEHVIEPFDLGEVSFHMGWLFHRAGPNLSGKMRKVMTIIYMDQAMRLKKPSNENQVKDWNTWCPGARIGEVIETHLNPVII